MLPDDLTGLAEDVLQRCRERGHMLATAESCTGGLIVGCLTEIAGSSDVVDRGFVTYSNAAKNQMLGVPMSLIEEHGAVSEPVARAMAEGAIVHSDADLSIAVTGVAGPGGGSPDKPVGLVHLASAAGVGQTLHQRMTYGDLGRDGIRRETLRDALEMLLRQLAKD
ncbi:MAG: CinA family protein [Alphaproteobacteria bacterium]|jgi:nicotinamide-nucleotide amidase|nr:CinA family protein [Alphaproteobacteria bacterium]MDP6565922.1 CinA family protein [Alphaproteobacteria bacterium]MDP6812599.1 CinA family protein [Alphaproteobacteria bacterium]